MCAFWIHKTTPFISPFSLKHQIKAVQEPAHLFQINIKANKKSQSNIVDCPQPTKGLHLIQTLKRCRRLRYVCPSPTYRIPSRMIVATVTKIRAALSLLVYLYKAGRQREQTKISDWSSPSWLFSPCACVYYTKGDTCDAHGCGEKSPRVINARASAALWWNESGVFCGWEGVDDGEWDGKTLAPTRGVIHWNSNAISGWRRARTRRRIWAVISPRGFLLSRGYAGFYMMYNIVF